jgi:hypothetical protein
MRNEKQLKMFNFYKLMLIALSCRCGKITKQQRVNRLMRPMISKDFDLFEISKKIRSIKLLQRSIRDPLTRKMLKNLESRFIDEPNTESSDDFLSGAKVITALKSGKNLQQRLA